MALAVSDMEICDRITPSYLSANQQVLQNARVIVADTNIPTESLVYLAENCTAPIFCDPVSTIKAEKLRPILSKIHTLKPNRLEAELLSGVSIASKADAEKAAQALLEKGVKRVFLSMGGDGMYAATADEQLWMSNIPGDMVNTTGCGDSATAALVWAWMNDLSLEETVRAGLAAGSITMESAETINPAMSATALKLRMSK
jgi:pseudouridine kinase